MTASSREYRSGPRADSQRAAARGDAVPDGGGPHARLRHHEPGEPRARLVLYGGGLPGHVFPPGYRFVSARRAARPGGNAGGGNRGRAGGPAHALRAGPSRPGARHVRPDPVFQRADGDPLGPRRDLRKPSRLPVGARGAFRRTALPALPAGDHRRRARGGGPALVRGRAHAPRDADSRRGVQPRHGGGARRQHTPALHAGVRLRRSARGARGPYVGPDPRGAAGHGRADPDRGVCGYRNWRHRFDPRRARRRPHRRHGGYAGPRVRPADACDRALGDRRRHCRAGARLDADLPADGDRSLAAAARARSRALMNSRTRAIVLATGLVFLAAVPLLATLLNQPFYLDLVRRIMIFAIAALSLNLILGYGGMISFGHAAYLGIGAYAVGVLAHYGIDNGFLQWALAIGASALVALAIGAVSIRTSGVYFIMITLAFTQMLYYLGISIEEFGGDDGMRFPVKSQFPGLIDLNSTIAFYYLVLGILVLTLFLGHRLVNSRFGMVIRAAKSNEVRTGSIGFSPYPYRLAAFVIAGAVCGLAGALLVNHTAYLTPEFMNWTRSGELMFMVILGGMGSIAGPVLGAFALLLVEDALSGWTQHWQLILGPLLVLSVLFLRRGLAGLFFGKNE